MSNAIGSATQAEAAAQTPSPKAHPHHKQHQTAPTDPVTLSKAAAAAIQEATETAAQTAKEAGQGDVQAQKLQSTHEAAKEAPASSKHVVA